MISNLAIAVASSIGTALCYLLIANLEIGPHAALLASLLLVGSVFATLSEPAFSDLLGRIQKSAYAGDLEAGSGHYQTFVMIAKMTGFSLVPWRLLTSGSISSTPLRLAMLIEAVLLSAIRLEGAIAEADGSASEPKKLLSIAKDNGREIGLSFLNGLLSFPMIALALFALASRFDAQTETVTTFWIATSAISVVVNFAISRGIIRAVGRIKAVCFASLSIGLALLAIPFAPSAGHLVAGFCCFTLGNPIVGTVSRNLFFHAVGAKERRQLFGLIQTASAIGVSIGVALLVGGDAVLHNAQAALVGAMIVALLLLRIVIVASSVRKYERTLVA